jgi:hypothetical protein
VVDIYGYFSYDLIMFMISPISSYSIQKVDNNTLILYISGYILDDLIRNAELVQID